MNDKKFIIKDSYNVENHKSVSNFGSKTRPQIQFGNIHADYYSVEKIV